MLEAVAIMDNYQKERTLEFAKVVVVTAIVLSIVLSVLLAVLSDRLAQCASTPPVEDCLNVQWLSATYPKTVTINNPLESPQSPTMHVSQSLSLFCKVEVLDPNRIIGLCSKGTITRLTDSQGRSIEVDASSSSRRLRYEGRQYLQKFVIADPLPRWRQMLRSLLRIQSNTPTSRQPAYTWKDSYLSLEPGAVALPSAGKEITRVEGYFYALTVESIEYVDVPFEPNNTWVRLTPDLEVRLLEAQSTKRSYRFKIEANPPTSGSTPVLYSDGPLPSRLVIARQLLKDGGEQVLIPGWVDPLRPSINESGSDSTWNGPVRTLRYVVGVNPTHSKIPFTLEHIPLPEPRSGPRPTETPVVPRDAVAVDEGVEGIAE